MKKIISAAVAVLLAGSIAVIFCACGAKDEDVATTKADSTGVATTLPNVPDTNEGMITDSSEKTDDGVIGDIITDVSEGISDAVTDISEDISEIAE